MPEAWQQYDMQQTASLASLVVPTSARSALATARATLGVVTTMRKLNRKPEKLCKIVLAPTAPSGAEPSRPTSAAAAEEGVSGASRKCWAMQQGTKHLPNVLMG